MANQQKNLKLNHLVSTVSIDGSNVFIRTKGDAPFINFFQVRADDQQTVFADVVASVRFNNLEQLENLAKMIQETIKNHQEREK